MRTTCKEAEFVLLPLPLALTQLKPLWAVGFRLVKRG